MQDQFIKSTLFFQHLLSSYFQRITSQVVETLLVLSVCHLFGLYNELIAHFHELIPKEP